MCSKAWKTVEFILRKFIRDMLTFTFAKLSSWHLIFFGKIEVTKFVIEIQNHYFSVNDTLTPTINVELRIQWSHQQHQWKFNWDSYIKAIGKLSLWPQIRTMRSWMDFQIVKMWSEWVTILSSANNHFFYNYQLDGG